MAPVRTRIRERRRRMRLSASMIERAATSGDFGGTGIPDDNSVPILAVLPVVSRADREDGKPAYELALELVLNEITLQARLTTNATGAVLALARAGELACRATTGATAPDVAVCLRAKPGIAATCYETGEPRRVDDLGPDENTDAVAYRRSGVRSILVVPVQGEKGPILGILEIFSPRPNAFCDRDVLTLQALARRIAANIELVQQSLVQQSRVQQSRVQQSLVGQGHAQKIDGGAEILPDPRVRAFNNLSGRVANHVRPREVKRPHIELRTPKFVASVLAQRSRLASVDWISFLAKSAIGLVLISGTMLARSCWERNGSPKFVQLIQQPMSQPFTVAPSHPVNVNAATVIAPKVPVIADPSTWPIRGSGHSQTGSSIIILRQPVRRSSATAAEDGEVLKTSGSSQNVGTSDPKTVSQNHLPESSKAASKDPAAGVLPEKVAGSNGNLEVLPTQAAMARLVQRVEPEYPNAARRQHIQGTVLLDVMVDETGAVTAISQVSGESQLMAEAEVAVKQWRFQPLTKGGKTKQFESRIPIDFKLVFEGASGSH